LQSFLEDQRKVTTRSVANVNSERPVESAVAHPSLRGGQRSDGDDGMLIIAGYLRLPPARRRAFIEAHANLATCARTYPGCLDLSISEDPCDPSRINLVELWESSAALEVWIAERGGIDGAFAALLAAPPHPTGML
jgi:quinol monooxygenase YgiN